MSDFTYKYDISDISLQLNKFDENVHAVRPNYAFCIWSLSQRPIRKNRIVCYLESSS